MKKGLTVIFILLCGVSFGQSAWNSKANFIGTARNRASAFSIPSVGKGYFVGGYDSWYTNLVYEYDTLSNAWTQKANYPGAPTVQAAFSIGGKGYVGTGVGAGYSWTNDFYEYDPGSNTWTPRANFPGVPRGYCVGFATGGKGYIGCGQVGVNVGTNDFFEYDPGGNSWKPIANYPGLGQLSPVGFGLAGKGYVGTGSSLPGGSMKVEKDFYEYDPGTNVWTKKMDYGGGARGEAIAFALCDKGYFALGYDVPHASFTKDCWEYNPIADTWTRMADYGGMARAYAPAFAIGKFGYSGTGQDATGQYTDFWAFHKTYIAGFTLAGSSSTNICEGDNISFTDTSNFNAISWKWSFPGGTPSSSTLQNPTVTYNTAGVYDVQLTAYGTCDSGVVLLKNYITVKPLTPKPNLGKDTTICGPVNVILDAGSTAFTYQWSTGESTPTINVLSLGQYWVQVSGGCGNFGDTIEIGQGIPPTVDLGVDTTYCATFTRTLDAGLIPGSNYTWSTGANSQSITVNSFGTFAVTITNGCGSANDAVTYSQASKPYVALGNDTGVCDFTNYMLTATGSNNSNFYWSTGDFEPFIRVYAAGTYWVTTSNQCGYDRDSIVITDCRGTYYLPNAFSPNGDSKNDFLQIFKVGNPMLNSFNIYSRWGELMFSSTNEVDGWDGTFNGQPQPVGVYAYFIDYKNTLGETKVIKGNITLIK